MGLTIGMVIAMAALLLLSVLTGLRKKKQGTISVAVASGLILGTLVGGTSTIGTAQLAFNYGMSAWWFTLGAGIGCLLLCIFYVKPLRAAHNPTVVGIIRDEYGKNVGMCSSILNALGLFINILSQFIGASALIMTIFPNIGMLLSLIIAAGLMIFYVVVGGTKGAGIAGIMKLLLLSATMITLGVLVLIKLGGFPAAWNLMGQFTEETGVHFKSLFSRGFGTDFGSCISLCMGVVCTQTYAQATLATKTDREGRLSALISAFVCPMIGIFGILVGLYMRKITPAAEIAANGAQIAKSALITFILEHSGLPKIIAGLMLGALFITVIGAGAGITLGAATVVQRDMIHRGRPAEEKKTVIETDIIFIVIMALCVLAVMLIPNDTIQDFAFLSMGLRACTVFAPLLFCLFLRRKQVKPIFAMLSIVVSALLCFLLGMLNLVGIIKLPVAAVIPSIVVAIIIMFIGYISGEKRSTPAK